ncbi:fungal specific transcription factor domain-containing protein [Pochonia chlamydosporia 170]|uniref:Fungal specific transcription factor domain-containing protein n=1 Tax=Pochonia chlamydosporia 170 TaxID=1380566 RepID=A0A179EZC5_METCM|nr:fungal specific transcription factor domain-containing protein [Pochonia chlamydosporia 170]OAQ58536.1 fungal specific transcription factor domain-containing protein [Pochonia chlamydosporia 170]
MDAVPSPYEGGTICNDIFSEQQFTNLMASINNTTDWIGLEQDQALLASCHGMSLPSSFKATLNLDASCDDRSRPGTEHEPLSTGSALTWTDPGLIPWLSPTLASPSEELAFSYYINDASTRIPAFDSPKNPYRKLCLVAISYPLLLQTILYVSAISMKNHDKGDEDAITHCRAQALLLLQKAAAMLETQKAAGGPKWMDHDQILSVLSLREVTLVAYLMHIAAEVMVGSQTAGAYLQDAYSLMIELDYIDHLPQRFYARFLTQRFAMIDVVLSFLRHRKPFAPKHFVLCQPIEGVDEQEPSFRELTGCPQAVLSFLARLSILANEISRDSCAHIAEAYQLESEMRLWGALRYPGPLSGNAPLLEIMPGDGAGARDVR